MPVYKNVNMFKCLDCEVQWNEHILGANCFNCDQPGVFDKQVIMDEKGNVFPPFRV